MHTTDPRQPKQFSPTAMAVRDAILSFDRDDPSHAQIAEAAGVSVSTVQRAIKKLCDAGALKHDCRFRDNKQLSNSYQIPTTIGSSMLGQNDRAIYNYVSEEEDQEEEPVEEPVPVEDPGVDPESLPEPLHHSSARHSLELSALGFAQCRAQRDGQGVVGSRPNILIVLHQADELVEAFASHVTRVGPVRRRKFHDTAYRLLMHDRRPFDEILDVIEHAFANQNRLAHTIYAMEAIRYDWMDRGLTRLRQVRDFYPEILADMARSS